MKTEDIDLPALNRIKPRAIRIDYYLKPQIRDLANEFFQNRLNEGEGCKGTASDLEYAAACFTQGTQIFLEKI